MRKQCVLVLFVVVCLVGKLGYTQDLINANKVAKRGNTTGSVFSPTTVVNSNPDKYSVSVRHFKGYAQKIAPSSLTKNSESRVLATFDVRTNYAVIDTAKLHVFVNDSKVDASSIVDFYVAQKNVLNSPFIGDDFNVTASSTLIDNFNSSTAHLGVKVEVDDSVSSPPATGFNTEYVIDVTSWYQSALSNSQSTLGFVFFYKNGPLKKVGTSVDNAIRIFADDSVTGEYLVQESPWLEVAGSNLSVPEPLSIVFLGMAMSALGIAGKFKRK